MIYLGSGSKLKKAACEEFFYKQEIIPIKTTSIIDQPKGLTQAYEAAAGRIQEMKEVCPPPTNVLVVLEGYVDRALDSLPWLTGTLAIIQGPNYFKVGVSTLLQLPIEVSQQIDEGKELGLCVFMGIRADKTIIMEDVIFGSNTRYNSFIQALTAAEKAV